MSGPRRLLAIGYQGFGNLGDEAILTGIDALLAEVPVTVSAIVCGPQPGSVVGFPSARRIPTARLLPTPDAIRALWASDGLLLSGGGLIHDHWQTVIPRYLAWIALSRLLGKPVVWVGVGVGPIRRRWQRVLARVARRLTALALVRDIASAELLGGVRQGLEVMPDPAVFNERPMRIAGAGEPGQLAIIIRGPAPGQRDLADALAAALVDTCAAAGQRGLDPVLLVMGGRADDAFVALVNRRAQERGVVIPITPLGPTPAAVMERLAACRAVVSVRLHGVLMAALAGVPCVPVAYDAKVRAAAVQLGIEEFTVAMEHVTPERLLAGVAEAIEPDRQARVEGMLDAMRGQRSLVAGRVAAALGIVGG